MAYIIDTYNRYNQWDKLHSRHTFYVNRIQYAIKEIENLAQIPNSIEQDARPQDYLLYPTYEDALHFVYTVKTIN